MMSNHNIHVRMGFPEDYRSKAAIIVDEAFGPKLSVAVRSKEERVSLLTKAFVPQFAIAAFSNNELAGIAGLHTRDGSILEGMTYKALVSQLGILKGNRAAFILSLYDKIPAKEDLYLDNIAVNCQFRSQGIGSLLLDNVFAYAKEHHYKRILLDVVDTNPRAKKLYEQKGFKTIKQETFPYLRWLLTFGGTTTMAQIVA